MLNADVRPVPTKVVSTSSSTMAGAIDPRASTPECNTIQLLPTSRRTMEPSFLPHRRILPIGYATRLPSPPARDANESHQLIDPHIPQDPTSKSSLVGDFENSELRNDEAPMQGNQGQSSNRAV